MSTSTPTAETDRATRTPIVGVLTDGQTYKNLLYLFLRFPLGTLYFTVLVTGFALGAGLAILLVGFLILGVTIAGATYVGSLEALLANCLLGTDIEYEPHDPTEHSSLVDYGKHVLTDVRSYVLLVYMLATFPVGMTMFTLVVFLVTFTLVTMLAPFTYWHPATEYQISVFVGDPIVIDTLPEALLLAVVGVVAGYLGIRVCNFLAGLHGRVTAAVLD